jgi:hypothetical protein
MRFAPTHRKLGSDYVESILNRPGSKGILSQLSLVEMESVFAIKVRTGALDENGVPWLCDASRQTSRGAG